MAADNNSFTRSDTPVRPSFEERKKDLVQHSNARQLTKKENAWAKWLRDVFLSGRSVKDILIDIATNQVAPQIKDNVRNSAVSFLDMLIYKDHKVGTSSGVPSSFVTNYVSYSSKTASTADKLEANKKKEEEVISSGYECPAFARKIDADNFLKDMKAYVSKYADISVHDLAWMQGKRVNFAWDKYGWTAEEILSIEGPTHISNPSAPWAIVLPKAGVLS